MEPVRAGSLPDRLARRSRTRRPVVAGIAVGVSGYVVMTTILVALGLLLTKVLLDGPVGRWDYALDRWQTTELDPEEAPPEPVAHDLTAITNTAGAV